MKIGNGDNRPAPRFALYQITSGQVGPMLSLSFYFSPISPFTIPEILARACLSSFFKSPIRSAQAGLDEYKAAEYSRKYLAEHEADIEIHRAAQATFRRVLAGAKFPKMDALKAEWQKLSTEKKTVYKEYRAVQKDMRELITAKSNIDHLLGLTDTRKERKWRGSDMTQ